MTDIAKCVCGAEAVTDQFNGDFWAECTDCEWSSSAHATEPEAIAAWNRVMRPRPVVSVEQEDDGFTHFRIRDVTSFLMADELAGHQVALLTAAGFDVESEEA